MTSTSRLAADEAGRSSRQDLDPRRSQRSDRREFRRQTVDDELVEVLRTVEILEPVLAQVDECDPVGQGVCNELASRLGDEDLAAVRGRGDAGRAMHIEPDVVVARTGRPRRCAAPS